MKKKAFAAIFAAVVCLCLCKTIALAEGAGLSMLSVSSGTMEPAFDAGTTEYTVTLPEDNGDVTINSTKAGDDVAVTINGASQDSLDIQLGEGEVRDVVVQVTDGDQTTAYTLHIHRPKSFTPGTFTVYSETFTPADVTAAPDKDTLYMTDSGNKRVYAVDLATGNLRYLKVPYMPRKAVYAGGRLLVTLAVPAGNSDEVAVIDPVTFTITNTINVDIDLLGVVADDRYIYAYTYYRIEAYDRDSGAKISSVDVSDLYEMKINPSVGNLYVTGHGGIDSYHVGDGHISLLRHDAHYATHFAILPGGRYLMLGSGMIMSCDSSASGDLQYVKMLPGSSQVACDVSGNEFYVSYGRLLQVYDASDLTFQRVVSGKQTINYLLCASGKILLGRYDGANLVFREMDPDALMKSLKINGEPSSEFSPLETDVDWGEVSNSTASVNIEAEGFGSHSSVSGDIGERTLAVGKNTFSIIVGDTEAGCTETYTVSITRRESDPQPQAANGLVNLGFTPLDSALDSTGGFIYTTAENGKSLYRVNLVTGEITEKDFGSLANHLAMKNGKIYVTLLRTQGDSEYGAVAVVDATSFKTENIFDTTTVPYDIEADDSGNVFIAPAAWQWSELLSCDSGTGEIRSLFSFYEQNNLARNPVSGKIYYITTKLDPRDLAAFETAGGLITKSYDSPYHGDYDMATNIAVSPDGKYIFNGTGNVFVCAPTQTGDMVYDGNIGSPFTYICFDITHDSFYTSQGRTLTSYDYGSRAVTDSYDFAESIVNLFHDGTNIIALLENSNGVYFLRVLNPKEQKADLSSIEHSAGTLSPNVSKNILSYSLILDAGTDSVTITPDLSDDEASFEIDGAAATSKAAELGEGEAKTVSIEVSSKSGYIQKTYTIHIYRETSDRSFVISTGFFKPNDRMESADGSVYMTGEGQRFIYKFNGANGVVTALPMPGIPEYMGISGDLLLVTFQKPKFAIGMIDLGNFSLTGTFDVDAQMTGVKCDSNYIYAYNDDGVAVYDRTTHQKLSYLNMYELKSLQVNTVNGMVYVTNFETIYSYSISDGHLQLVNYLEGHTGKDITIMPDGKHLLLNDGTILTSGTSAGSNLQYVSKIAGTTATALDQTANELYCSCGRNISVFDASDFHCKRTIPETSDIQYLMCAGGILYIEQNDNAGNSVLRSVYANALLKTLKINGDAFSEFYPLRFDMDRGDVPHSMSSVSIDVQAAKDSDVITGDGTQPLVEGENTFIITVTDPSSGTSEKYTLKFSRLASDPPAQTTSAFTDLGFTPLDVALDPDRPVEYMTAVNGKSIYRVNLTTGEVTEKDFDLPAERLTVRNGKIYLTLLRTGHQYLDETDLNGHGAVAVIDTATFQTESIFDINVDPYDIEADEGGIVFLTPGSNQFSVLSSYNSNCGQFLSSIDQVFACSFIKRNTQTGKVYSVNQGVSPIDIEAYEVTNGAITKMYDSPYHGDHAMTSCMIISPDGKWIFNGSGNIFACQPTQTGDMVYQGALGKSFTSICFDLPHDRFYTANGKTLASWAYDGRAALNTLTFADSVMDVQMDGGEVAVILKKSNGTCYLSKLVPDALLSALTLGGTPLSGFDPQVHEYNMTVPSITASIDITASAYDSDGTLSGDIGTQPLNFGTNTFTVTVTGAVSGSSVTYTLHITRPTVPVTGVSLDKKTLALIVGQTVQLTATVSPGGATNKAVTWSSDNLSAAIVDNGTVTGLAPGPAVVRVSTADGGRTDICNVTVKYATVSFMLGGSSVGTILASYNSTIQPEQTPARTGYSLSGWYKDISLQNEWNFSSDKVTGDMTLYAAWIPNTCTVSYDANGGTGSTSPSVHTYDKPQQLTANGFSRAGYSFAGWAATANGSKVYNDKQTVSNLSQTDKAAITLYAVWIANSYRVTFDPQGGSLSQTVKTVTYDGAYGTLPAPSRTGYTFGGWYTGKNGSGTNITAVAVVKITADQTLYARWLTLYAITAAPNNTAYGSITGTGKYGSGLSCTLKAIPNNGFRFVKWMEGSSVVSTSCSYTFSVTRSRTLQAVFASIGTPTLTSAAATGYSSVKLAWSAVTGASGYVVYRATSQYGTYTVAAKVTGKLTYTDTGLATGTTYYYKIKAYCLTGSVRTYGKAYSNIRSAKPILARVTGLKAVAASTTGVKLTWSAVAGATGYDICQTSSTGAILKKLGSTATLSFTKMGLTHGVKYYFKVRAYRLEGTIKVYGDYSTVVYCRP